MQHVGAAAFAAMEAGGVVAILRGDRLESLDDIVAALAAGGVRALEISLTSPRAWDQIARAIRAAGQLRGAAEDGAATMAIGAGTVMTVEEVSRVREMGGAFIVSPIVDRAVIAAAIDAALVSLPGAYTPTEAVMASRAGATAIKLFPADALGPAFLAGLRAPLPDLKFVPTGGVTLEQASAWARAGAWAIGVGQPLFSAFASGGPDALRHRAAAFVAAMRPAREAIAGERA